MRPSLLGVLLAYASSNAVALRVDDDEDGAAAESPQERIRCVTQKLKKESEALHEQDVVLAKTEVAKASADLKAACAERAASKAKRAAESAKAAADLAQAQKRAADCASKMADKHEDATAAKLDRAKAEHELMEHTEKAAETALLAGMNPAEKRRWEELKTAKQFKDNFEEAEMQKRKELAAKEGKRPAPSTPEEAATEIQVAELRKQEISGEISKRESDLASQTAKISLATEAGEQLVKQENLLKKDVEKKAKHAKALHEEAAEAKEAYFAKLQAVDSGEDTGCDEAASRGAKTPTEQANGSENSDSDSTAPCPLAASEKLKA